MRIVYDEKENGGDNQLSYDCSYRGLPVILSALRNEIESESASWPLSCCTVPPSERT